MFINADGEKITERAFRNQHPDKSFPAVLTGEILSQYGLTLYVPPVVEETSFLPLTRLELLYKLLSIGITEDMVDAEIAKITDSVEREKARITWREASAYHRDHSLVEQIRAAFGLTATQVDNLWTAQDIA